MREKPREEDPLGSRFLRQDPPAVSHVRDLIACIVRFRGYSIPAVDREDLTQEIMLQIWEAVRKPAFDFSRRFESFVRVVATRRCIDWFRNRRPERAVGDALPEKGAGPLDTLMREERVSLARTVVGRLEQGCRELILLHVGEKKTYRQIAERLGRSEGALRFQMFECVRQARKILQQLTRQAGEA